MITYLTLSQVLKNLTICNPDAVQNNKTLKIEKGKFIVNNNNAKENQTNINCSDFVAMPGLINAHDHLLGSYLPKVGNGPYLNWLPWDDDLKASEIYTERKLLDNLTLYRLGYYRQILSGVTTVCDHIPHIFNNDKIEHAYIRIIDQYCLAHEISSFELPWGNAIKEIANSKSQNIPFITHICEGFDLESCQGIHQLKAMDGLGKNTVLVHGISCDQESINLIAKSGTNMVWCPNSNIFMFNKTMNVFAFSALNVNISLGTDSALSGGINLLEEMKFAQEIYRKQYNDELNAQFLFKMVTSNPAKAFNLTNLGKIETGFSADMVIIPKKSNFDIDPYKTVTNLIINDIKLVARGGKILYFQEEILHLLKINAKNIILNEFYEKIKLHSFNGKIFYAYLIDQPTKLLHEINDRIKFIKNFDFLPIVCN